MKYVLFVKQSCSFCAKAQKLLKEREKNFEVVDFEGVPQKVLQDVKQAFDWPTVPMVFKIEDKIDFLGGYTDLVKYLAS